MLLSPTLSLVGWWLMDGKKNLDMTTCWRGRLLQLDLIAFWHAGCSVSRIAEWVSGGATAVQAGGVSPSLERESRRLRSVIQCNHNSELKSTRVPRGQVREASPSFQKYFKCPPIPPVARRHLGLFAILLRLLGNYFYALFFSDLFNYSGGYTHTVSLNMMLAWMPCGYISCMLVLC